MKADIPVKPDWQSFSAARSSRSKGAAGWLVNNVTSARLGRSSTHRQCVEAICASASHPIPIVSVCEELGLYLVGPRGTTFFGPVGSLIDGILANYADVSWWVTEQGLHIGVVGLQNGVVSLNPFDGFAGPLVVERWSDKLPKANTKLSKIALEEIAEKLDASGFVLIESLPPKDRAMLASHNQTNNRRAIKSFTAAIKKPLFARMVRRRVYLARTRYLKAAQARLAVPVPDIPECFWSLPNF